MKHARKGGALLMASLLLAGLSAGCRSVPEPPAEPKEQPLQWVIVDSQGNGNPANWNGRAVSRVFGSLEDPPSITYYTGEQDVLISRMLTLDDMPDILTVPAGGAIREKVIGAGRVWNMQELSGELYASIPESVRQIYQNNSGELFSLPGGYCAEDYRPAAAEGVYVRQEYASLLGNPDMDTVEGFAKAVEDFVSLMTENRLISGGDLVPVVFGVNNSGLATVEHFCGVRPVYREGNDSYHRIFSPEIRQALTFFDRLDTLSVFPIFEEYSAERLMELLQRNVFVYIGPSAFIESFNLAYPRAAYQAVTPPFAEDGYLEAQSRWGAYETFVSRDCDPDKAAALLSRLSSPQTSRTLLYGVEDEDWVMVNGHITPLKGILEEMQRDPLTCLRQTGVAAFPYLSRDGILNPYRPYSETRAQDISLEKVYFSAADYHGYYVLQMDKRLAVYYAEAAGPGVSASDIAVRIRALESDKEPLTISH